MSKYCMIEIAFNNKEEINEAINVLLSKRLVASTHIIESNSSWNWKNERESVYPRTLAQWNHVHAQRILLRQALRL